MDSFTWVPMYRIVEDIVIAAVLCNCEVSPDNRKALNSSNGGLQGLVECAGHPLKLLFQGV